MINTAVQDPWLVLYVKHQTEKKVTERLQALGITVYLPTITVVRQWSDRKKKLQIPAVSRVSSQYLLSIYQLRKSNCHW